MFNAGSGTDTFIFKPGFGNDVINNFNVDQDTITLDHTMFSQFANVQELLASSQVAQAGGDVVITVDGNNTITLHNMSLTTLQAHVNDFRFA